MLVPKYDDNNNVVGHVPSRASKNPIIGVIRCNCGEFATVHNPKGKRANFYYTICDNCKTDQRSGENIQAKLRENMRSVVEDLPGNEKILPAAEITVPEPENPVPAKDIVQPIQPASSETPQDEPVKPKNSHDVPGEVLKSNNMRISAVKAGVIGTIVGVILGVFS